MAAERGVEIAHLRVSETEWGVRSRARGAWLDALFARRAVAALARERQLRADSVEILERRLAAGEAARPEVDLARTELINADVALRAAETHAAETWPALAGAMGVPVAALAAAELAGPPAPPQPAVLGIAQVQRAGLLNRIDVRRALAEYAGAEVSLRLEIAKQYPDIQLAPAYGFDEGHYTFSFSPALALPVLNRNGGQIAEAEARRAEAEARFKALEARAIEEMESALARYGAAVAEWEEARGRLATLERGREAAMEQAVRAGAEDRLALIGVRIQGAVAARAELEALRKAQAALAALEDAVQRPLLTRKP